MSGRLIAFEGSHCSGKSTQIEALDELAKDHNLPVHVVAEWKHPKWRDYSRAIFSDNPYDFAEEMYEHKLEILRANVEKNRITDRIKEGQTILIDRYIDSMFAKFTYWGIEEERIQADLQDLRPADITFCFYVSPALVMQRARHQGSSNPLKKSIRYNDYLNTHIWTQTQGRDNVIDLDVRRKIVHHRTIRSTLWPNNAFDKNYSPNALGKTYNRPRRIK